MLKKVAKYDMDLSGGGSDSTRLSRRITLGRRIPQGCAQAFFNHRVVDRDLFK
ncbi:MAG: hypothetical protein LRY53_11590 [Burkholderiaceae bacterium]|nr:hypothetical protein [Burkholderiaceae bacterium]MCD8566233.1 hypothetical protein [Burkholderiaceae bacterium]